MAIIYLTVADPLRVTGAEFSEHAKTNVRQLVVKFAELNRFKPRILDTKINRFQIVDVPVCNNFYR